MLKKIMEIYAEYSFLRHSYCGREGTDWLAACKKLEKMQMDVVCIDVRFGKNFYFYSWLKNSLYWEITKERDRVCRILLEDSVEKEENEEGFYERVG